MKDSNCRSSFLKSPIPFYLGFLFTTASLLTMGCAMCCGPYDYHYPSFGGKHERIDPTYGRVGSVFSDPMAIPLGESADSNLDRMQTPTRHPGDRDDFDREDAEEIRRRLEQELEQRGRQRRPIEELPSPDETTKRGFPLQWQRQANRY